MKVFDESMSAYTPQQATKTIKLPHLFYNLYKPEALGRTKFKVIPDSATVGMLLHLEVQEGRQQMANAMYAKKDIKSKCSMLP